MGSVISLGRILFCFIYFVIIKPVKTSVTPFHSAALNTFQDFKDAATQEEEIVSILFNQLENLKKEKKLIDAYLEDYLESSGAALDNVLEPKLTPQERGKVIGASYVLGHRMICRFTKEIVKLKEYLSSAVYYGNTERVRKTLGLGKSDKNVKIWPNKKDKVISMRALLYIEEVYGLPPHQLFKGLTKDTSFGGSLDAFQSIELAMFAFRSNYKYFPLEWLKLSKNLNAKSDNSIPIELINYLLNIAHLNSNPNPEEKLSSTRFNSLCQGQTFQTEQVKQKLKCFFKQDHPYLTINPVKVEQLSEEPPILQFYEMVREKEIEKIMKKGVHFISMGKNDEENEGSAPVRTSIYSFKILNHEDIENVMKLAEIVSGLDLFHSSEHTQMVEYSYGGFYSQHNDAGRSAYSDRLATMLYYLELPKSGGSTPMVQAGIYPRPAKGSAVLWYNMYRNGTIRQNVDHGACPVIHGHKIIMNHWVGYGGNFLKHKCSLRQTE